MKNIEKYKDDIMAGSDSCIACSVNRLKGHIGCTAVKCVNCNKDALKWLLSEYKEPILDEVEKKYLSDVIRPFRKEVETISKFQTWANDAHYIYIEMKDRRGCTLPFFPKGTMYKGMKAGRHYSLKELGL